jgi:hypothetical protein
MNNLKTELVYEVTKNERTYKFYIPVGAPLGELYDVCYGLLADIVEESKKSVDAAKPQETKEN